MIAVMLAVLVVGAIRMTSGSSTADKNTSDSGVASINVTFAGDLVMHSAVVDAAKSGDTYDFTPDFKYVKKYINSADVAACDLESVFNGKPYTGYPTFCCPSSLATSMKSVGFDMLMTASNHSFDYGYSGMRKTLKKLKKAGLKTGGTRLSTDDERYTMFTVKGVKVAIIPYSYATGSGDNVGLNDIPMGSEKSHVNYFTYKTSDAKEMAAVETKARKAGAKVVIMFCHWGDEYNQVNKTQKNFARKIAKYSTVDAIIGSHPHCIQKYDTVKNKDGEKIPVYYAIGNLLSNQRSEILNEGVKTEEGVIVQVKIKYDNDKKKMTSLKTSVIPYWLDKFYDGGKTKYRIVPLNGDYKNNSAIKASGDQATAAKAKKDIYSRLGIKEK